jgi:ribonuclease P protein component
MLVYCKPIKGYNVFYNTFKKGKKLKTEHILTSVVFNNNITNDKPHTIYYGVTISKRLAKKAIIRNRVKRLLRESIRLLIKEFEATDLALIDNIVLMWQVAPKYPKGISLNYVMSAVKNIFEQALNLRKIKNNNKIIDNEIQS